MKHFIITACLVSAAVIGCTSNEKKVDDTAVTTSDSASTTSKISEDAPAPLPDSVKMKNWQAYATPGEMQKMMASWNGTWNGKVLLWHKAGMAPDSSKATSVNKMIMGGRYQISNFTGNMMGMPFEGMSKMAYDNAKKVFISTWIDNMGTGISTMEGTWDAATKTMTMTGKMVDPERGDGRETVARQVFRVIDDIHHVMEMYGPGDDGKEFKWMEINFTKK